MAEVFFFVAAFGALAGAVGVIWDWNPFYNVLSLVAHLLSLAALFLLLRSEFLAAAQVVIYAGAVMVLYVFVVAYIGGQEPDIKPLGPNLRPIAVLFVAALLVELCIAILGTGLQALGTEGAPYEAGFGSPAEIGRLLLTKFLLPFELASLLLLIAAVGAVVLARRRGGVGIESDDGTEVYSVVDALRPAGTGTMKEAVSGIPEHHGQPVGTHPKGTTDPQIAAGSGASSSSSEERGR
jgi:NADH:ubiquinone oxidoreductase subunit 6 (subunit J)